MNKSIPTKDRRDRKWELHFGVKELVSRRSIKPIGRLFINGKYLSIEETSNYIKAK